MGFLLAREAALQPSQEETNYTLAQAPGRVKLHADYISKRHLHGGPEAACILNKQRSSDRGTGLFTSDE